MKLSVLTLVNLAAAATLLLTPFLVSVTSSAPYDPWNDLDENGKIDIFDVVKIASTYGTTGDSEKNVTVTNWPTRQFLNVSLADHVVIPEQDSMQFLVDVAGYDRLTLVVVKHTSGVLMASVHYKYGEIYSPSIYATPDLTGGSNIVLQDSIVIGPTIWIELTTTDFPVTFSAAIYAVETSR
jgi:hypothetical protein